MQIGIHNGLPPLQKDILETTIQDILRTYNASMWLAGPEPSAGNFVDSLGATPLTTSNGVVGYVEDILSHEDGENACVNSVFSGAAIGVAPTGMSGFGTSLGITQSVVGVGSDEDGPYIDVNWSGTASSNYFGGLTFGSVTLVQVKVGEVVSSRCIMQLLSGTWLASQSLLCNTYTGALAFVDQAFTGSPTTTKKEYIATKLVTNALSVSAQGTIQCAVLLGQTINVTLRVWQPACMRGRFTSYLATSGTAVLRSKNQIPAYQGTTGFKPILRGGVVNHVRNGTLTSDAINWFAGGGVTKESFDTHPIIGQTVKIRNSATTAQHSIRIYNTSTPFPDSVKVEMSMYVRYVSGDPVIAFQFKNNAGAFGSILLFDAMTGRIITGSVVGISLRLEKQPDGFYLCIFSADSSGIGPGVANLICYFNAGLSVVGSLGDCIEVGGGMMLSGDVPYEGPFITSGASGLVYGNNAPFSWKFDGTDDRLVVANPTINPAVDHFRIVCYRAPAVVPVANSGLCSTADNVVGNAAAARLWIQSGTFSIQGLWRDDLNISTGTFCARTLANEKVVVTARRDGLNCTMGSRGDLASPINASTVIAHGATTVSNERIGGHAPAAGDTNFCTGEIYGVISGNGNPTAGEILALENFLAGIAGFVPLA